MTAFAFGKWTFGVNLEDLLERAKFLARVSNYDHLSTVAATAQKRVAEICREAIWDFLNANPALGLTTATISLVASTQSYAVPATLAGCYIEQVAFTDTGSDGGYDGATIPLITPSEVAGLPLNMISGEATSDRPQFCALDITGANLAFYPMPSEARSVTVTFRAAETTITAANVASPTGVTVAELPTLGMEAAACYIGAGLASGINDDQRAGLMGRYSEELLKVQKMINRTLAASRADNIAPDALGPVSTGNLFGSMEQDF